MQILHISPSVENSRQTDTLAVIRVQRTPGSWSSLIRARARGFTGVLRHGGTLLFRLLAKPTFRKRRENFIRALRKCVP